MLKCGGLHIVKGRNPVQGLTSHKSPHFLLKGDTMKSNYDIALEVLSGAWGNGVDRRNRLTEAGYNYSDVQTIVNALVKDGYLNKPEEKPEEKKDPEKHLLEIDYDPEEYEGIQVNVLV